MTFVFKFCRDMRIDDPVEYLNRVPSEIIDQWMAFYIVEADSLKNQSGMMSPDEANKRLAGGGSNRGTTL